MTTVTLSDGSLKYSAELEGGVRGGIVEHPVYASNEPEMGTLKQEDWVGGRGADNFHLDPTKFYDALDCWTLTPGHLHQSLQWKFAKNIRISDFEMPGDVTWKALLGSQLYISRSFTTGTSYAADKCYLWLRRRGSPGTLTLKLHNDTDGSPGSTVYKTVTLTTSTVTDVISVLQVFDWATTETLDGTYHLVVYGAAGDNAGSHWEVGVNASGSSSKIGGGVKQVETATIVATITTAGNATITVTATGMTGSPKAVSVAVALGDTAALVAGKVRTALLADTAVTALFDVSGTTDKIILTAKTAAANDATLNIASANGTCVGVTSAATSANTTAGVAPGTVWESAGFSMYYRVTGADVDRRFYRFSYDGLFYMVDKKADGAASQLWMNGDRGKATSATSTTLTQTGKTWGTTRFVNAYVQILRGTGVEQIRQIVSHVADTLTVATWTITPDSTSEYVIYFTDYWTECTTTGLGQVTSRPIVANAVVYFPQGASVDHRAMRNNAGVHEYASETDNRTDILYTAYDAVVGPIVWSANNTTVTVSRANATVWATPLSFGTAISIGDTANPITGMVFYSGDFWVFKEDRPWLLKNDRAVPADIDMSSYPGPENGAALVVHNRFLYMSWAQSLERLYGGTLDPIGPDRGRLSSNRKGVHAALEPVLGSLITSIDAGTGTSSVMVWNGAGWHEIFRSWEAGKRIREVGWQANEGARPRLWIEVGGELVYLEFPGGGETTPLDDSNMCYQHEGVFYSGTIDARDPSIPKYFEEAYLAAKNLSTTGSVVYFDYQVDKDIETDNWIEADSFLQSPLDRVLIDEGNISQLSFRLRINSSSASTPIDITNVGVKLFARTPLKYAWDIRLKVDKIMGGDPSGILAWLKEKAERAERVTVTTSIPELDGKYVKVRPPTVLRSFQTDSSDLDWGGTVLLTLQE